MQGSDADAGTTETVEDTGWETALAEGLGTASDDDNAGADVNASEAGSDPSLEADSATGADVEAEADEPTESETKASDALEPPERWTDDDKTHFRSLDQPSQEFLLRREADVEKHLTKRTQDISESQKRYERLDPVLKPYEDIAQAQGVDLAPIVGQAMQTYAAYVRDPVSTVKALIGANQWTAEQLGLAEAEDGAYVDPDVKALRSELQETKQELASIKQGNSQAQNADVTSAIGRFKSATDDDGNLLHPHFDTVSHLMSPLIGPVRSIDEAREQLQAAYDQVVWTVPEFRDAKTKASQAETEKAAKAKAEEERQRKLKAARDASTLGAADVSATGPGKTEFNGWEGALQDELSQH